MLQRVLDRFPPGELFRLVRFGLTGVAGFAVDFGTLVLLRSGLGAQLALATFTAYVTGGVVHYLLTRFWVFPHPADSRELGKVVRYLLLAAVNIVITLSVVVGLNSVGVDYRLAKLIAVGGLFFSNYYLTPRFVMPAASEEPAVEAG